jgi:hypothetical protein
MKAAYDKAMERTILNFELLINTKESSFSLIAGLGIYEDGLQYAKLFRMRMV